MLRPLLSASSSYSLRKSSSFCSMCPEKYGTSLEHGSGMPPGLAGRYTIGVTAGSGGAGTTYGIEVRGGWVYGMVAMNVDVKGKYVLVIGGNSCCS